MVGDLFEDNYFGGFFIVFWSHRTKLHFFLDILRCCLSTSPHSPVSKHLGWHVVMVTDLFQTRPGPSVVFLCGRGSLY